MRHGSAWFLAASMALLGAAGARAADLTVGAFGGIWEQSLRKCVIDPFQAQTGKSVDVVLGAPTQWMNQIAASPQKPPIDVIYMPTENAYDAIDRGLVNQFTKADVPNAFNLVPRLQAMSPDSYGVPHNYGAMGIIYNAQTVKDPPKTWKDFVDGTIAGKWKASMPSATYPSGGYTVTIWSFAKQYGGDVDNIQPGLDIIKKMQDSGNLSLLDRPERRAERAEERRHRHGAVLGWARLRVHR